MKHTYEVSTELEQLAIEVIKEKKDNLIPIIISGMKIVYVESNERKKSRGGLVFVDTRVVKGVYRAFIPYDFIITFYLPHTMLLDENQMRILMWHELKHCGITPTGEYCVIPHDIEDFSDIIDIHGHKWANMQQVGGEPELDED